MALFPTDALLMMWHYAEFPVLVQTGGFVPGNLTIPPGQIYHSLDYRLPVADPPQNVEITAIGGSFALSRYLPIAAAYAESHDFHTYLLDLFEAFRYEQIGTANFSVDGDSAGRNVPLTHASSETIEASVRNHPPFDTFVMGMMHDPGSRRFLPTGFATVCHRQDSACHAPGNTVTLRVPATSATQEYQGLRHGAVAVSGNLSGTFQQGTAILRRNVGRYGTPLFDAWDFASFSSRVTHIAKDFILFPFSYGAPLR